MRVVFLSIILFISVSFLSAQSIIINEQSLTSKDGVKYFRNEPYTGKAVKIRDSINILYNYIDGLLNGKVNKKNEHINYVKGIIKEYEYFLEDGKSVFTIDNQMLTKRIKEVELGIFFKNQTNDIFYYNDNLHDGDSTEFDLGIILILNNKEKEFIPRSDFKFKSVSLAYGAKGIDAWLDLTSNKVPNYWIKKYSYSWFDYTKVITESGIVIELSPQKIFFVKSD